MRKVKYKFLYFICLTLVSLCDASRPENPPVLDVSIFELLADPEKFIEKKIRVVGVAGSDGNEDYIQTLCPSKEQGNYPYPGYYLILSFNSEKMRSSIKQIEEFKEYNFSEERETPFFEDSRLARRYWWNLQGKYVMLIGIVRKSESLYPEWNKQYSIEDIEEVLAFNNHNQSAYSTSGASPSGE